MKTAESKTAIRKKSARKPATPIVLMLGFMLAGCGGSSGGTPSSSPTPSPDSFASTGVMRSSRIGAMLSALTSGSILVAGGYDNDLEAVAKGDLYRLNKKSFKSAGSALGTARYLGTSTTLNDGTVLLAGGVDETGAALAGAEIYDPATGVFKPTANNMSTSRMGAAATLLSNGMVLIAGGLSADGQYLSSADLYDPATSSFTASLGTMSEGRQYPTASSLPNGMVLVAGGCSNFCISFACQDADLYDPATDAFTASTGQLSEPRDAATGTLLASGKVLIAGGQNDGQTPTDSADLYDPSTDTFTASQGILSSARAWAIAAALPDGKVLIAGGLETDPSGASATADLYDPTTDTFTASAGQMTDSRAYAVATPLSDGTVLIAGGLDSTGTILSTADIYYP